MKASKEECVRIPTQLNGGSSERLIAYHSWNFSIADQNDTADERELIGLLCNLNRFTCYSEGFSSELLTADQLIEAFVEKHDLDRKEAN